MVGTFSFTEWKSQLATRRPEVRERLVDGRHSIRDDFAKLNYRLTKRHMLLDLAMKPITVIVQLPRTLEGPQ